MVLFYLLMLSIIHISILDKNSQYINPWKVLYTNTSYRNLVFKYKYINCHDHTGYNSLLTFSMVI